MSKKLIFNCIDSVAVHLYTTIPLLTLTLQALAWVSPTCSIWYGHVIITPFLLKTMYLVVAGFMAITTVITLSTYFTSKEIYDFYITLFNFFFWIVILFFANSIFTVIFIIEVISALLMLLLSTSSFGTSAFYATSNLKDSAHLLNTATPSTFLNSILYFFWISLISSLNFFLFILFLYYESFTFDWFLLEYIFLFLQSIYTPKELFMYSLVWFVLIFCFFLKCGLSPFFLWKPIFFKGIPFHTLFIYICFFYFYLFLFIIHLLTSYFSEILFFYSLLSTSLLIFAIFILMCILCESYYIKSFLAMSSILNSLLVFLALVSSHTATQVLIL